MKQGETQVEVAVSSSSFGAVAVAVAAMAEDAANTASPTPGQTKLSCLFNKAAPTATDGSTPSLSGAVMITKDEGNARVDARIKGLSGGSKSFHFHTYGDLQGPRPALPARSPSCRSIPHARAGPWVAPGGLDSCLTLLPRFEALDPPVSAARAPRLPQA